MKVKKKKRGGQANDTPFSKPFQTPFKRPRTPRTRFEVLIFASKDDPAEGWSIAKLLRDVLVQDGISVRLINKLGFDLDDLTLVAQHQIIQTPTVLILRNDEVVFRHLSLTVNPIIKELLPDVSR